MKKILIVDDEAGMRESLSIILEDESYDVIVAEDGFAAFRLFTENRFDLILTDIGMPVLTGLELIQRIKREFPDIQTKIVAMSGKLSNEDAAKLAGCDAFIVKPIDKSELIRTVKRLLEQEGR